MFAEADDAIKFCCQAQRSLVDQSWPAGLLEDRRGSSMAAARKGSASASRSLLSLTKTSEQKRISGDTLQHPHPVPIHTRFLSTFCSRPHPDPVSPHVSAISNHLTPRVDIRLHVTTVTPPL